MRERKRAYCVVDLAKRNYNSNLCALRVTEQDLAVAVAVCAILTTFFMRFEEIPPSNLLSVFGNQSMQTVSREKRLQPADNH